MFVLQIASVLPILYCLRKLMIPFPKTFVIAYNLLYPIISRDYDLDLWNAMAMMCRLVLALKIIGLELGDDYSFVGLIQSIWKTRVDEKIQSNADKLPSKLESAAIPFKSWNILYILLELLIKYAIYCTILIVQKERYPNLNPIPRHFGSLENNLNIYSLGIAMSFLMEVMFAFGMIPLCLLTGCPYFKPMQNPYFSTSVADFWSSRWNLIFQHFYFNYCYKTLLVKICGIGKL